MRYIANGADNTGGTIDRVAGNSSAVHLFRRGEDRVPRRARRIYIFKSFFIFDIW